MKKLYSILLSIIFTAGTVNASFLKMNNPYVIGPEGRTVEDLRSFARPNQMFRVMPNRPVVATDASGARLYYTPTGKLAVSINKSGETTFSLNGVTKTMDSKGNLTSVTKSVKGTNISEVQNEFGEIIGYKETGYGGKVIREYDKDKNLTRTINYNEYGKKITSIVNEMTKGQTVYDDNGLAAYDLDYEGNRMAKYEYDDKNRLVLKTDAYGNRTHFDENGAMKYTESKDGMVLMQYNYDYDDKGNYTLKSSFDPQTRQTTYYENNKQTSTKNYAGAVVTDYFWNGSKLVATFDRESQETSWYDIDGKTLYTSFNDEVVSKNLYYKGQLVGVWDARSHQVTVFKNERREVVLQLGGFSRVVGEEFIEYQYANEEGDLETGTVYGSKDGVIQMEGVEKVEPTAEDVMRWIAAGLIDEKYLGNIL